MSNNELPKILIVDDTADNRYLYREVLSVLRVEIIEATTGNEAIAAAQKHDIALVLLDIKMPVMDGYEVAAQLRHDKHTASIPIIFISADFQGLVQQKMGYRMGAVDILLSAPVDPEILRQKVRVFLELHRQRADKQRRIETLEGDIQQINLELLKYKEEAEVIRRQATNDPVTGLPNRLLFEDRLSGAMVRAQRNKQQLGLAYLDLDGFKPVNDQHGHAAGDEVLAETARRLVQSVRACDTVARLGGDEFALVLEALDSSAGAEYVGRKILQAFTAPFAVRSAQSQSVVEVKIGVSIGLALFSQHADNRNDLLMLADMAMYAVKRDGGGFRVAEPGTVKPHNVVNVEEFRQRNAR